MTFLTRSKNVNLMTMNIIIAIIKAFLKYVLWQRIMTTKRSLQGCSLNSANFNINCRYVATYRFLKASFDFTQFSFISSRTSQPATFICDTLPLTRWHGLQQPPIQNMIKRGKKINEWMTTRSTKSYISTHEEQSSLLQHQWLNITV